MTQEIKDLLKEAGKKHGSDMEAAAMVGKVRTGPGSHPPSASLSLQTLLQVTAAIWKRNFQNRSFSERNNLR